MGTGAIAVGIAGVAILIWVAVLVNGSRTRAARRAEEAPANLSPFLTDDELESKRLDKVLVGALIASAVLAFAVPIYYLSETTRQADAAEEFEHRNVELGSHWFEEFQCINCHGADGGGGGASYVEKRSNLNTTWAAPSINDVFYRYSDDEVRYWLVYGRANSPMPAWGLDGGGAMNSQQIDQLIDYLHSIEIDQDTAVAQVETKVSQALLRIDGAADTVAQAIADQRAEIDFIERAPGVLAQVVDRCCGDRDQPTAFEDVLIGNGTCTAASAELVVTDCDRPAQDTDRDGLGDAAEVALSALTAEIAGILDNESLAIALDPANRFSVDPLQVDPTATGAVDDLEIVRIVRRTITEEVLPLRVTTENQATFLARAEGSLAFLEVSAAAAAWEIDFELIADRAFEGDVETARRAGGLYNGYCARCHTAGYSAGVVYTQEAGSGAMGPALRGGRSVVQFPDIAGQIDFIIKGSENAQPYGINGIGRGWMPAFGTTLSQEDIELIVRFERAL